MKYLIIIFLLTACQTNTYKGVKEGFMKDSEPYRKSAAQTLYPERHDLQPPPEVIVVEDKFCYKTWTGSNCYSQPQEGQEDRRIGAQ